MIIIIVIIIAMFCSVFDVIVGIFIIVTFILSLIFLLLVFLCCWYFHCCNFFVGGIVGVVLIVVFVFCWSLCFFFSLCFAFFLWLLLLFLFFFCLAVLFFFFVLFLSSFCFCLSFPTVFVFFFAPLVSFCLIRSQFFACFVLFCFCFFFLFLPWSYMFALIKLPTWARFAGRSWLCLTMLWPDRLVHSIVWTLVTYSFTILGSFIWSIAHSRDCLFPRSLPQSRSRRGVLGWMHHRICDHRQSPSGGGLVGENVASLMRALVLGFKWVGLYLSWAEHDQVCSPSRLPTCSALISSCLCVRSFAHLFTVCSHVSSHARLLFVRWPAWAFAPLLVWPCYAQIDACCASM